MPEDGRLNARPQFAVVGCGRMGNERAKHIAALDGRVRFCVDKDLARAEALALHHPGATPLDRIDVIDWCVVDGVFVCTPPAVRGDIVRTAVDAGVAIFMEKPLGVGARDARAVADLVKRSPGIVAVGYMNRYRPGVIEARRAARSGVVALSCHWFGRRYNVPWWADEALSGGPFNEQATHLVDLCRYIGGEVRDVQSTSASNAETHGAVLHFESGAVGTLLYSCESPKKEIGLRLLTRGGVVILSGWDFELQNGVDNTHTAPADPFRAEVAAFIEAVVHDDASLIRCTVPDAYRTQLLVDRILGLRPRESGVVLA